MIWHFSHFTMGNAYGGGDRPGTMNGEWQRIGEAVKQCAPLTVDAATYGVTIWNTSVVWTESATESASLLGFDEKIW